LRIIQIHFILKVKRKSSYDFGFLAESFEERIVLTLTISAGVGLQR